MVVKVLTGWTDDRNDRGDGLHGTTAAKFSLDRINSCDFVQEMKICGRSSL